VDMSEGNDWDMPVAFESSQRDFMEKHGYLETSRAAPWLVRALKILIFRYRHANAPYVQPAIADLSENGLQIRAHHPGAHTNEVSPSTGAGVDLNIASE